MKLSLSWEEIKRVLEAPGIPNYEKSVLELVKTLVEGKVNTRMQDGMCLVEINPSPDARSGSGQVPSDSPFVLVGAHSDVLGGRVTDINDKGFIHFTTTGSSHPGWLNGRHVSIQPELSGGKEVKGVIGHKALHHQEPEERLKVPKVAELFIDVGAKTKTEVEKLGVKVGDPVIYSIMAENLLNDRVVCRGLDNRAGVLTLLEVIRQLSKRIPDPERARRAGGIRVMFAFWGGEEVGLIGGFRASDTFKPDVMINVDVGFATQTPATEKEGNIHGRVDLGQGVIINRGGVLDPDLVKQAYELAQKKKIKTQFSVANREPATDATPFNRTPARVLDLGIPCRYMHYDEVVDLSDIARAASLIVELLKSF